MPENRFSKQELTDRLKSFFGGVMFYRGREYFEQARVKNIRIAKTSSSEKIRVEAQVQGSAIYETSIKFNVQTGQFSHSRCSCPYDWTTCKHAAALGIAFIQDATKSAASKSTVHTHQNNEVSQVTQNKKHTSASHLKSGEHQRILPEVLHTSFNVSRGKSVSEEYHITIGTRYSLSIDIHRNGSRVWDRWPITPETLLQTETPRLTKEQKALFKFLHTARFYRGNVDLNTLFAMLKTSGIPLYLNKKSKKTVLSFSDSPRKIAAKLYMEERAAKRFSENIRHTDFILKLKEPLYEESSVYSFFGNNGVILVREKSYSIEVHPLSARLSSLMAAITQKARENAYYYEHISNKSMPYQWETILSEEDIININQLVEDAYQELNLETTLEPTFDIRASEGAQQMISVDYDNVSHTLAVQAMVDYGFSKIDVSHTIYKSLKGGKVSFRRNSFSGREKYHISVIGNAIHYALIDHTKETDFFSTFHADDRYGFTKRLKCIRKGAQNIADYHQKHWPNIQKSGYPVEYTRNAFDFFDETFQANVRVDMDAENDWLAFDVDCYCGKDRVTLEDLKRYVRNKEEFIRMNDGRMMRISNMKDLEQFVLMLENFHQKEGSRFEGRAYHAPELEDIFTHSPYYNTKLEKSFQKFMKEAQSGKPVKKVLLPKSIENTLRDYQKEGVHWMHFLRKYRFAGILADDMGLGKTLQTLTILNMNKKNNQPSLVICPKTLLFNWEQETEKFFPNIKTLIIEGNPKDRAEKIQSVHNYDLIITSYPSIKKDFLAYEKLGIRFHYCFIDEAQFMKNHKTQNAQIVKKIPADYRLALTGTPLENNVSEIWSIFDFLMPGFLGNYANFVKKYQTPIMKKNDAAALDALRKKISCFMLRRTKEKVLKELPPKIEQIVSCELEEAQNVLYQEILANVKTNIFQTVKEKGFSKSRIHILAGLTKLRQVCNHPSLLLKDDAFKVYESAKLKIFEELIDEIISSNRKVLVFSQFTRMLDILQDVLRKKGVQHLYLSGKTKNRKELVQEFNASDEKKVFLISLKAGGTGLNLTAADNVIIFDPWWNPSVENQAIDRANRMGQTKSVNVYRLVTRGTIEEKILKLQEKKQFLFDNLVDESKDLFKHLTWSDIKELFK